MKLYYSPGACSLASHIALTEAGLDFSIERVDLKAKKTEHGEDYAAINPKGYVPALDIDGAGLLTENVAVLDWIGQQAPGLQPEGAIARSRLIEMLTFISTEIHKSFKPFFAGGSDEDKAKAGTAIGARMALLANRLEEQDFLFGDHFTPADAYLFVMLLWARKTGVTAPDRLTEYFELLKARPAFAKAMTAEGLA